jgi:hypothetical protein
MDLKDGFLAVKVRLFLMKNEAMWIFTPPGIILPWLSLCQSAQYCVHWASNQTLLAGSKKVACVFVSVP